ncbi:MAG: hypothetical protein ABI588_08215 [Arenimonas sp.]
MSLGETLSRRRWGGAGAMLLILLALLLAVPVLRDRGLDHPLAGSQRTDLCPLLPAPPPALGRLRALPHPRGGNSATCNYFDSPGQPILTVELSSTRQLSLDSPTRTQDEFRKQMDRVMVGYGSRGEVAGNWAMAGSWHAGKTQSLLFEDRGVLVLLESLALDASALAQHARKVQEALRHSPDSGIEGDVSISSSGASSR